MGVFGVGLGGSEIGAGLRDLFGPAAVVQPLHGCFLRRGLSLGGFELRLQPAGVEPRQHLALVNDVAFLHQHRGDPLAAVERQIDLTQIDIAVEHELLRLLRRACVPIGRRPPRRRQSAGLR